MNVALFDLVGPLEARSVLDLACGHGRMSRELARRGARVVGVDVSASLLTKARDLQEREPLGIRYVEGDVTDAGVLAGDRFDAVVASFGLTDIDDLDGLAATVMRVLAPGGAFVVSMLHPCFAGGAGVSPSWPATGTYQDEGWWQPGPEDSLSTLRQRVGANHRKLSTYLEVFAAAGLRLDVLVEPPPPRQWVEDRSDASRGPVFLVARFTKA